MIYWRIEEFSNLATHASHGCYLLSGRPIEKLRSSGHPDKSMGEFDIV
jgi:hypothetical protein